MEKAKGSGCTYCHYKEGRNGNDNRYCITCDGGRDREPGFPKDIDDDFSDLKSKCCNAPTYGKKNYRYFSYCSKCGKNQGRY